MKWLWLPLIVIALSCGGAAPEARGRHPASSTKISSPIPSASATEPAVRWSIRAFPRAALSVALPAEGVELSARELGQLQALLAQGVRVNGLKGPTYTVLAFPISNPQQGVSIEQRLLILPYLLSDLGPLASRRPVALDGLPGVEFLTRIDSSYQRARVFATAHTVVALIVRALELSQTLGKDARLFFESLQWYDE